MGNYAEAKKLHSPAENKKTKNKKTSDSKDGREINVSSQNYYYFYYSLRNPWTLAKNNVTKKTKNKKKVI
jgi:hypothetical protein